MNVWMNDFKTFCEVTVSTPYLFLSPPQVCKGAGHGEVRHDPNNCCGFVYCMWPGTPSQAIIAKKCPTSLAFNVEAKQCDWAEAVKCGDRSALCLLRKWRFHIVIWLQRFKNEYQRFRCLVLLHFAFNKKANTLSRKSIQRKNVTCYIPNAFTKSIFKS